MSKAPQSMHAKQGENIFAKNPKVSAELLALTYGAFVHRLIKDESSSTSGTGENAEEVNAILDKMGYNIGQRIIDEFFAKAPSQGLCRDLQDTAKVIGEQGFKMFLGVSAEVANFDAEAKAFSLIIRENPLADFVILPAPYANKLWYSNILCGVIRGALEMVNMKVNAYFRKDILRGHDCTELRVELKEIVKDKYEEDEDDK
jgi:hypothetical protein